MINKLISVIIPVYNVKDFLRDCIESVSKQSYGDIEIILVDDGSTDGSSQICDEYVEIERRSIVIHQDNQGLSGARNTGINKARGEYITFIDSDDVINTFYIERLYQSLIDTGSDISVCEYSRIKENNHDLGCAKEKPKVKVPIEFNNTDAIRAVYDTTYHGMQYIACGKLFKKDIFLNNDIRFPIGKIHEDTFTTYKVLYAAHKICYIDESLYLYRVREGSIMNSGFSIRSLVKFDAIKEECKFFKDHGENELYKLAFYNLLYEKKKTIQEMNKDKNLNSNDILEFATEIRNDMRGYTGGTPIPLKKRVYYWILSFLPWLADL